MKLSITQIVLGVLIVLVSGYIARWMLFGVASLLTMTLLNESGVMVANVTPEHEILFTIARYAFVLLVGLGLVVVFTGAFWKRAENKKKLAITQIIVRALIVIVSVFMLICGYALEFIVPIEGGPVLEMAYTRNVTLLTAILGLAVLGVGIAQLVVARREIQ